MSNPQTARRSAYQAYRTMWGFLDWLYPPRCGGCGESGSRWCPVCQSQVVRIDDKICPLCGQIQTKPGICFHCQSRPPSFHAIRSWALFQGPVRNALHRLKYNRDMALGEVLAQPLVQFLYELDWSIDCIIPVPLGRMRQQQRGYNQAALLAYPIALATGIAYQAKGLQKVKETRTQVGLSVNQRRANVAGAYQSDRRIVKGRKVLIVDDVSTSGATMESCASAIMMAGADRVYGMTLAQAPDPSVAFIL